MGAEDGSERKSALGASQAQSNFLSIGSAVLYGVVAVSMNFVNKASMQLFPLPNSVMVLQMAVTFLLLHPLQVVGWLGFPSFSWRTCRRLLWITLLYTANVGFALVGLKTLNVPMYNVLKRLTPVLVLVVKSLIKKRWPRHQISASVLLVVAGCVVAGVGDLSFDMLGYLYALASCTMQAAYLLLVEFQGAEGVSTSELLYYNAITSLPFLLIVVTVTGEAGALRGAYAAALATHGSGVLWGTLLAGSLMGCLLNYALFLCTVNNSALTTTIVGVLKGVVAVVLGFWLLGGVRFSAVNVGGIVLNTAGAVWYTALKYQEKRGRRPLLVSASADPLGGSTAQLRHASSDLGAPATPGGGGSALNSAGVSLEVKDDLLGGERALASEAPWSAGAVRRHTQAV